MKLSAAIRAGSAYGPQVRGMYLYTDGEALAGSCALGGAWLAEESLRNYGGSGVWATFRNADDQRISIGNMTHHFWPELTIKVQPPVPMEALYSLGTTITVLNDEHGWTRDQIADWVESLGY